MGSRAYIAKINRDGSGSFIYLGHGCYPNDAGRILLEHYQEEAAVDALLSLGSITYIKETPEECFSYHVDNSEDWKYCQPAPLTGGTGEFFGKPYLLGPEYLYCWTPDGWVASKVDRDFPDFDGLLRNQSIMTRAAFQEWFDNNQEELWVTWRKQVMRNQEPQPLVRIIERYAQT